MSQELRTKDELRWKLQSFKTEQKLKSHRVNGCQVKEVARSRVWGGWTPKLQMTFP